MLAKYENIVIIPSLIDLHMEDNLNVYTKTERYEHTKVTIQSVRDKIPNSFVVLIDVSTFSIAERMYFTDVCDLVINEPHNVALVAATKLNKNYGEMSYLQRAFDVLSNGGSDYDFTDFPNLKAVFKVGGRYFLNEHFNYDSYNVDSDIVLICPARLSVNNAQTCLFKIIKPNVGKFIGVMRQYNEPIIKNYLSIENCMYDYMFNHSSSFVDLSALGMTCLPARDRTSIFDI